MSEMLSSLTYRNKNNRFISMIQFRCAFIFILFRLIICSFVLQNDFVFADRRHSWFKLKDLSESWTLEPSTRPFVIKGRSAAIFLNPPVNSTLPSAKLCAVTTPLFDTFTSDKDYDNIEHEVSSESPDRVRLGISSVGGCYMMLYNTTEVSASSWNLSALLKNDQWRNLSTSINVIYPPKPLGGKKVTIGSTLSINCLESSEVSPSYCRIVNNIGKVVSTQCIYTVIPVRREYLGNWTCFVSLIGSMTEIQRTISIEEDVKEYIDSWTFVKDNKIYLQCVLRNSIDTFDWCRAVTPSGSILYLSPGIMDGRYSAVSSNAGKKKCGIEIELPLDKKIDHGKWILHMGKSEYDYTGCIFTLPDTFDKSITKETQLSTKHERVVISEGNNLEIKCSVPWEAVYCYVRLPDGSLVKSTSGSNENLLRVGDCRFEFKNISSDQAGTWTCGLSSNNDTEDILFYTDVKVEVRKKQLASVDGNIEAVNGDPVKLLCRSVLKRPLEYCRFTNPQGIGYSFKPNTTTDSRLSYWGAGLEDGECGVQITSISEEDVGFWTCATLFNSYPEEVYDTIEIKKLKPTTIFTVIVSVCTILTVSLIIGLMTYVYRRYRRNRLSEADRAQYTSSASSVSIDSHNTQGREVSINTPLFRGQEVGCCVVRLREGI